MIKEKNNNNVYQFNDTVEVWKINDNLLYFDPAMYLRSTRKHAPIFLPETMGTVHSLLIRKSTLSVVFF